jgi:predicted RNA-binding Zn-ribbon protein involved in translation (DUF1610 family)
MPTLKSIEKQLAELDVAKSSLQKQKDDLLRKTLITCETSMYGKGCGARLRISNLTYIQTHSYEPPYSCIGGDYWSEADGEFDCPKCGRRNRMIDREQIRKLKHLFKDIKEEHNTSYWLRP